MSWLVAPRCTHSDAAASGCETSAWATAARRSFTSGMTGFPPARDRAASVAASISSRAATVSTVSPVPDGAKPSRSHAWASATSTSTMAWMIAASELAAATAVPAHWGDRRPWSASSVTRSALRRVVDEHGLVLTLHGDVEAQVAALVTPGEEG
jgi:hypothetical protein